ncbi:iron-containing alcohol dehydrogenase [Caldifermentibacillus hisashii]|uniref:Iron-containing alcohol dehydrogenase n=2 Tax=Bacillaceae TaxID=186817 RepID=A0ABU9JYR2_9BACI|nr:MULTISPECIES: iron-containing alcohol dehydrogenase [Bacillaceae]MCB5933514.1 iron-containing alcohol dehydrogenase [Bacillus sp. DFI.2.34]AWI12974.1 L-threonine dehydrogenase [Caldibacillus thermoamylovorans]MCB7070319.1 iron-containing alcohol dehydrogenase [Caldibacillus sp. 210928-DFI.2.22]MCB7072583.1 iron-containing alcohol dehydrogenase [Caldibacillus sp. 210928-DFI.2.18]MCB7077647.1 iron-containing alcohol dehydrogenase [Caldibacillus thermoamylovorans]
MATSEFYMPTVNLFGVNKVQEVGSRLKGLGCKKTLIVTDEGIKSLGYADQVAGIVREAGLEVVIYSEVKPNPTDKNVEAGLKIFTEENCDSIISLGGGSPHDCAKGIGLVAANGGTIHDYEGVDRSAKPMVPLAAINTTAGTASEMTKFTIITDTSRKVKMAIVDKHVTPTFSVNDPMLMIGMPPSLTAATGLDALTHAVEAYVSTAATPITDACALKAIEIIPEFLPRAFANGQDLEAREQMIYAQYLAGMAFNNASLGYVHAIAHQFGGFYDLPHGVCNAILLPHVSRFNLVARPDRFRNIAIALGENVKGLSTYEAAEKAIATIERLARDMNIPNGFKELGAKEEDIPVLAEHAMADACAATNPRKAKLEEVMEIIRQAM